VRSGRKLTGKLNIVILVPVLMAAILLGICFYIFDPNSKQGLIACGLIISYIVIVLIAYIRLRPVLGATLTDYSLEQGKIQKELLHDLSIPYTILDEKGHVLWANRMFYQTIGVAENKHIRKTVDTYIPGLKVSELLEDEDDISTGISFGGHIYNAELRRMDLSAVFEEHEVENPDDDVVVALYLFDVTEEKAFEQQAFDQKMVAGLIYIDNYDEVMDSLEEIKHSILTALVDRKINVYLRHIDAIVRHIESDKYFFVFPQKYLQSVKDDKFSLLDDVKSINVGNEIAMTLSIGIGCGDDSFNSAYENAKAAIGLALGRGGDQTAVKSGDSVTYFGGKSAGTEKTTRVKARVKAQAFEELLEGKDKVLIMAHKRPDADAFGSSVGIYRLCTALGKKAYIVLNEVTDAIRPLVESFTRNAIYNEMMIDNKKAMDMVSPGTLLVVCDVNRPSMTECSELLDRVSTVVVFDHHRQSNEAIRNATLSYIEPFASSACEMIAEMYQYISAPLRLRQTEADAMYAGILIDTDNFLNKTGVRTFEAASYLRKSGADMTRVRNMFRSTMPEMKERAQGIANAEIFLDQFALSYVDPDPDSVDPPTVPVAKVANELLNVKNIKASFVVTEAEDGTLYVSARSVGDVNVQLLMEHFNGGGHANIAGAQLSGVKKEEFFRELRELLEKKYTEGDI